MLSFPFSFNVPWLTHSLTLIVTQIVRQIRNLFVPDLIFCVFCLDLSYHFLIIHLCIHVIVVEYLLCFGAVRGVCSK